jgi:hypothetical protein
MPSLTTDCLATDVLIHLECHPFGLQQGRNSWQNVDVPAAQQWEGRQDTASWRPLDDFAHACDRNETHKAGGPCVSFHPCLRRRWTCCLEHALREPARLASRCYCSECNSTYHAHLTSTKSPPTHTHTPLDNHHPPAHGSNPIQCVPLEIRAAHPRAPPPS